MKAVSAKMSSTYTENGTPYTADNCIDGVLTGTASLCHTGFDGAPWLALDFGAEIIVDRVVLHNRDDSNGNRLSNAEVRVANQSPESSQQMFSGGQLLDTFKGPGEDGEVVTLTSSSGLRGRYVIAQIPQLGFLHLNEFTVWGTRPGILNLSLGS